MVNGSEGDLVSSYGPSFAPAEGAIIRALWRRLGRVSCCVFPSKRVHFRDLTFRLPSVIRSLMDGELRKGIDSFAKEYVHGF
jgi:hypothetical protein